MSAGRVAVIGAGLMGSGIAQVAAQAGYDVVLHDTTSEALHRAMTAIEAGEGDLRRRPVQGQGNFRPRRARRSPAKRHQGNRGGTAGAAVMVLLAAALWLP